MSFCDVFLINILSKRKLVFSYHQTSVSSEQVVIEKSWISATLFLLVVDDY